MIIYDKSGNVILDVQVDDSSFCYRSIMQEKKVELHYSLTEYVEIPVGSYIEFGGERYTLWYPENFEKHGTRNFEYKVTFGGNEEILKKYKYKLLSAKPYKLKFPLTAKPKMFIQLLVDNLNLYDSGWQVGTCIEATEKLISFSHESCWSALGRLTNEFGTEFEIVGKTIHFCKVEKYKDAPLALSYGKGNGFVPGLGRANQGDNLPVEILYVQGGDRNIDFSTYGSQTLLLPKSHELEYEGHRYKTDEDGMYICRADRELSSYNEDGYDAGHIYPSRVGEVTAVTTEESTDTDGNPVTFYNIIDTTIPDALNYRDCRLKGNKATIIFQSGKLTGREFDIVQSDSDLTGYDHETRTFQLVSLQADGMDLPNNLMCPAVGDKYAIFNIKLPDAYVCENSTKTGASWDMFREAARYLAEHEEQQFAFSGELDGIWAKKRWLEIGGKLVPGGYIDFSDTQFQPEGILIRIISVTSYINNPHSPRLDLSNTPVPGFLQDDLGKLESDNVTNDKNNKDVLSFTMRRYQDMIETGKMLEKAIEGFSASINPITISTMQIRLGTEQLQFRFVDNKTNPSEIIPNFVMNNMTGVFTAPSCILQHMSLGITKVSPVHAPDEYRFWDMLAYTSPYLGDDKSPYYLYAKCSKSSTTGTFLLSKEPYKMEEDSYYFFLIGTLGTEWEDIRSFTTCYGFTEILPGRMIINLITSADGKTYFNLAEGEIGGKLTLKAGSSGLTQLSEWTGVSQTISSAFDSAHKAQDAADNAQISANSAVSRLNSWASDSYISPTEKTALKQQMNEVLSEYNELLDQATRYGLLEKKAWKNYNTAYGNAVNAFEKYTASTPENIYVGSDYGQIARYYIDRIFILQDVADTAKGEIDDLSYLKEAIANETKVIGGLLLTSLLKLGVKNGSTWTEKAGINGTAKNDNDVIAWFGGTLSQAVNDLASIVFRLNGAGQVGGGAIKWYLENGAWNASFDGIVKMKALQMTMVELGNSDAVSSGSWSDYSMYKLKTNLNIVVPDRAGIILPSSLSYEGSIVVVCNTTPPPYTKSSYGSVVRTENGYGIGGINRDHTNLSAATDPTEVYFIGQTVQFMAVRYSSYLKWIALNY